MFKGLVRVTVPVAAFGAGVFVVSQVPLFSRPVQPPIHHNEDALSRVVSSPQYQQCAQDNAEKLHYGSHGVPLGHRRSFVPTGLLSGADLFGIDPIIFTNPEKKTLTGFYHLGKEMVSHDGQIHNGAILTIMDGELCKCGFPELPSKRGVTASLELNFHNQAQPNSIAMLSARVVEIKGRKVVIEGVLEELPSLKKNSDTQLPVPVIIATSRCVLVEPRWFKYVAWMWQLEL